MVQLPFQGFCSKKDGTIRQGKWIWYFKNEELKITAADSNQIKTICSYLDDQPHGNAILYYQPNQLKEETIFDRGVELSKVQYYKNGQTKRIIKNEGKQPISRKEFFENGQLMNDVLFTQDAKTITLHVKSYYENGKLHRDEQYSTIIPTFDYQFVSGKCYNREGEEIKEEPFMKAASFPGGKEAMRSYIKNNLVYPRDAASSHTEGKVVVAFIVDKSGNITKPAIIRSVAPSLNREAIRIVKNMPKWTPEIQYGKKVSKRYSIPVNFRLM